MRVLHVIDSLAAHGAERSLVQLAPHLLRRGISYEVAFLREPEDLLHDLARTGVRIHDLRGTDTRIAHTERLTQLIRGLRPELVHTTLYRSDVAGRMAAHATDTPAVTTWASTGPTHGGPLLALKRSRTDAIDRWTARYAQRFHAVSEPVARVVGARLGVSADKIDVIPRGRSPIGLGQRSPERRRLIRGAMALGEDPVVLALARHEPAKGIDLLIEATATLRAIHQNLRVLVAGDHGSETDALRDRIAELELENHIFLLGPRQDVGNLLAAADVCVVPSRVEGFPGTVIESCLVGTPVVAADLPAIRAAIPSPNLAEFFRVGDVLDLAAAIESTLGNRSLAITRARRARQYALEHFSLSGVADATIAFYQRALARVAVEHQ